MARAPTMRLLMLAPASAVHTLRWANGLCSLGAEVHLAFLSDHLPPRNALDERVNTHVLPGRSQAAYVTQALGVARLARRVCPQVVNAHYASGYGTLLRLAKLQPSVLSTWGSDVFEFPDRGPIQHRLVADNLRFARVVTSSSHVMAARIAKVTSGAVTATVIPFGVDPVMFHPDAGSNRGGPIRFGIVKTLEPHYRIDVVIDAFERYLTERGRMSATLDIYGDGRLLADLRARVERLGIHDRVAFRGHIAHRDVPSALQSLDAFLLASETESFGVAAVEAMACGVPVIASDAPGFVEVLGGGRYGLLYPRGDVAALARHMITVGADAEVRRDMVAAGLAGSARYDWKRNLADMFDVLEATANAR